MDKNLIAQLLEQAENEERDFPGCRTGALLKAAADALESQQVTLSEQAPLPEPEHWYYCCGEAKPTGGFTEDQMREYGRLCRAAQDTFQQRVQPWMLACFGAEIAADAVERNHRFFEEATELVQACGMTSSEAHQLVDYVFNRPVGDKPQEVGGVMVTLAALCLAQKLDMHQCGEGELARIWTLVEKIRAKQAAKPKNSPLPEASPPRAEWIACHVCGKPFNRTAQPRGHECEPQGAQ